MRFIHLSDFHIGRGDHRETVWRLWNWISQNQDTHGAGTILLTGDIVEDGAEDQYQDAKILFDAMRDAGYTVLAVPGNHDDGLLGILTSRARTGNFSKYLTGDVSYPYRIEIGDTHFILLDSMLAETREFHLPGAQGKLGTEQIAAFDELLDSLARTHPQAKVVVALHHHPFFYDTFQKIRDDAEFKAILAKPGRNLRLIALLFGHEHVEKRFNEPGNDKEAKYGIGVVYAAGAAFKPNASGKLVVPVLDVDAGSLQRYLV